MKVDGQLESATLEQLATNPATSTQGRIFDNTTTGKTIHDNGTDKRAILKNDSKLIVGNDPTEANNVRIHKAGAGVLQDVPGNDATAEGTPATTLAQRGTRAENLTSGTLPAAGNAGRQAYLTDQKVLAEDDGAAWRRHIAEYGVNDNTSGTSVTLATITSSVVRLTGTFSTLNMIPAGFPSQRVTIINRTGIDISISNESGGTVPNRILTGTGSNITFKHNSSLSFYYDGTSQRWQVVGEASGSAASGGGVPNSSVIAVTSNYTALITDDIILADTTNGGITITLPSAAGNLGLRLMFVKIGTRQNQVLTLAGTINGVVNEQIWALNAPFEIYSDGAVWRTSSVANGTVTVDTPNPNTFLTVAAVSTANVSLETMSEASLTTIDNIRPKSGHFFILKNQTSAMENGVYVMPATNIVIAAVAFTGVNVDINTLANGTSIQIGPSSSTVVSTGDKVSLRFQTNPLENGIYVVGATAGTSVRDISQRHPSYTTPASLEDFFAYSDFYNYPSASAALAPTETSSSHTNNRRVWKQTVIGLSTFLGIDFYSGSHNYQIKVPSNAKVVNFEICPFGGAGSGGRTVGGGGGGAGAYPFTFNRPIVPGDTITVTYTSYAPPPGTGQSGSSGTVGILSVIAPLSQISISMGGGSGGTSGGAGGLSTTLYPGPIFFNGGNAGNSGTGNFFVNGGTTTGALNGGGGGAGLGSGGGGAPGTSSANVMATNGGNAGGLGYGGGGGGGGGASNGSSRPGRGGFGGAAYVRMQWG